MKTCAFCLEPLYERWVSGVLEVFHYENVIISSPRPGPGYYCFASEHHRIIAGYKQYEATSFCVPLFIKRAMT